MHVTDTCYIICWISRFIVCRLAGRQKEQKQERHLKMSASQKGYDIALITRAEKYHHSQTY